MTRSAVVAFLWCIAMVPLARAVAVRTGAVAEPRRQRWNLRPIPLLGGAAVLTAVWAAAVITPAMAPVLLPGTLMAGLGLVDDYVPLRPVPKFGLQAAIIAVALAAIIPPLPWTGMRVIDFMATGLWLLVVTNAFNLIDNIDGLCAGVAAIAAGFLMTIGSTAGPSYAGAAAAVFGAAVGFLLFNFHPARIFLGDSGSLFFGTTMAVLSCGPSLARPRAGLALAAPIVLLAVPLFDTLFVILSRRLSRRPASQGGRDHTSHRLVAMGFGDRDAVLVLYGLATIAGLSYYGLMRSQHDVGLLLPLLAVALLLIGVQLATVGVYEGRDFSVIKESAYRRLLADIAFRRRVFDVLLDAALVTLAYYGSYVLRFPDELPIYMPYFWRSLPYVLVAQLASFVASGIYSSIWRHTSVADLSRFVRAVFLGVVTSVLALVYVERFAGYSRGVFIIYGMALLLLMIASRLSFRWLTERAAVTRSTGRGTVIYGAGDAGALAVRELRNNPEHGLQPIGFLDDDPTKAHKRILGLPVLGGAGELERVIAELRPEVLLISTSKLPTSVVDRLQSVCHESGTLIVRLSLTLAELPRSGTFTG